MNETFHDTWARVGQGDGFSFPAGKPIKRIDYLWISKDKALVPLKAWIVLEVDHDIKVAGPPRSDAI